MIPYTEYYGLWKAHRDWLDPFAAQIIFTGHVQLGKEHFDDKGNPFFESITVEKLDRHVGYFIKKLSRQLFGTKAINEGSALSYMGRIEGRLSPNKTGDPRLHVHFGVAGIPLDMNLSVFCQQMCKQWEDGHWGYRDTLAEPCYGEAWKNYVLKKLNPYEGETFITNVPYRESY